MKEKEDYCDRHRNIIKRENEMSFLENKEKVHYHSIIIMELFNLEDFNILVEGLNEIYTDLNVLDYSRLINLKNQLKNQNSKLFNRWMNNLPVITNFKLKDKVLPNGVLYDLGPNIDFLDMKVYGISPSVVMLQVNIILNSKASERLNEIIYNYYDEIVEIHERPQGKYENRILPHNIKEKEIINLRSSIKLEAINFLKKYFSGFFFNLTEDDCTLIPSIDLFSLNYPKDEKKLREWVDNKIGFFNCFSTLAYDPFKYENYLLLKEDKTDKYRNYLIFANRKDVDTDLFDKIDASIIGNLESYSFELFAIYRWLKIQEKIVGRFNSLITNEILDLGYSDLNRIINNRKKVYHEMFNFERFKTELDFYNLGPNITDFISLENKNNLSKDFLHIIKEKIKKIEKTIKTFNKYSDSILNLKNVEYAKKSQDYVVFLTVIVIFLTLIQVISALKVSSLSISKNQLIITSLKWFLLIKILI